MKDKSQAKKIDTVDNLNVYYWVSWKPEMDKSWIVVHPGASMNHSSMGGIERRINALGHPTIVFDQRGIGHSEAPAQVEYFALDRYSDDIRRIIAQEGLEKPDMFTHSFGFMVATDYINKTQNVSRMTSTCPSYNFRATTHPFLLGPATWVSGKVHTAIHKLKRAAMHMGENEGQYNEQDLEGKSDFSVVLSMAGVSPNEWRVYSANNDNLRNWDIRGQLGAVKIPVQLIYTKGDPMVRPYAGETIAKLIGGPCDVSFIDGSHTVPIIHPERVLEVMKYK